MRVRVYLADESLRPVRGWGLGRGVGEKELISINYSHRVTAVVMD